MRKRTLKPQLTFYDIAEGVTAFSSTRHGGYSQGNYGAFNVNLYCGDDPADIAENRKALCQYLKIDKDRLVMPHQVHGTGIAQIGKTFFRLSDEVRTQVLDGIDALMTNERDVCIGVSTADCIPIIIYDPEHHAASVVHSGWRGTVANIAGVAVTSMQMAYHARPEMLKAVIGPGISLKNFEVGDEVYEQFAAAGYPMEEIARRFILLSPSDSSPILGEQSGERGTSEQSGEQLEKWHIDLWQCCRLQLEAVGLLPDSIYTAGICTYDQCEDYFSARRLGIDSGRILTGIVLK